MEKIPLYVINNFLKFDRKIYQVFGFKLGRPIRLKSVLFFFVIGAVELLLCFSPVIGHLIRSIPPGILFAIPVVLAWMLSDVGTEGRSPVAYFRSFILFNLRRFKGVTYYLGREIGKPKQYHLGGFLTYGNSLKKQRFLKTRKLQLKSYMTYRS